MNSIIPSIMQSIKPQYCELIAAGRKTYEVRKTRPKIETPFKAYIYQTSHKWVYNILPQLLKNQKKVIGEYICDEIIEWTEDMKPPVPLSKLCLSYSEIRQYGGDKPLYLYHISNLKIYDEPKALSEFRKPCKCLDEYEGEVYCDCLNCEDAGDSDWGIIACDRTITRPPQSWCYCEEV